MYGYHTFFSVGWNQLVSLASSWERGRSSLPLPSLLLAVVVIGLPLPFMSPNLDSPVQTQMAVAIFNSPLSGECRGNKMMEGKAAGRRRVFVQTETGCVLGACFSCIYLQSWNLSLFARKKEYFVKKIVPCPRVDSWTWFVAPPPRRKGGYVDLNKWRVLICYTASTSHTPFAFLSQIHRHVCFTV